VEELSLGGYFYTAGDAEDPLQVISFNELVAAGDSNCSLFIQGTYLPAGDANHSGFDLVTGDLFRFPYRFTDGLLGFININDETLMHAKGWCNTNSNYAKSANSAGISHHRTYLGSPDIDGGNPACFHIILP
jgi:hypothetical protein